jgi:hypothetical protein
MDRPRWKMPCILALVATACAGLDNSARPVAGPSSSPSGGPSLAGPTPLMPTPQEVGDETRLALTFPDGSEAVVAYPSELDLSAMGVQPDVDFAWKGAWVGAIVFVHGGPEPRLLDGADPLEVHQRHDEAIEEWTARRRGGRHQRTDRWLVFRLPSWTVHVPLNARTDSPEVIDRVRPYQTGGGFVAIKATEPAALAEGYGEAGGPKVAFGDRDPLPDFVRSGPDGLLVDVAPSNCDAFQPSVQVHGSYGSACLAREFFVNATSFSDTAQSQQKLEESVEGLRLLELEPAS